jgi:hypothetical protein
MLINQPSYYRGNVLCDPVTVLGGVWQAWANWAEEEENGKQGTTEANLSH